jgi:type I restriction enzyme S subunit
MSEWNTLALGELCEFKSGTAFPKDYQGELVGNYPFIKVSDMNLPGNERIITCSSNWINEAIRKQLNAYVHQPGAIVFAKIGIALTYNRRRLLQCQTIIDNNMMSATPHDSLINSLFFYYLLRIIDFNTIVRGTALPYISIGDLSRLNVRIPPLSEQRAIAHILGTLDDKIELNRKMNQTLEAMAQAIFKSWFVDFDPVHAKAEGHDLGLPPHIVDLFPDRFEDSELGQIPAGWQVKTISDLAEIVGGSTPFTTNPEYWRDGSIHWATPKDLSVLQTPIILKTERKITQAGLAQISSNLLPKGTILLSSRAPIGYLAVAEVPLAINQGFIAMKPKFDIPNLFLLFWASLAHNEIIARANGSTFLEINKRISYNTGYYSK